MSAFAPPSESEHLTAAQHWARSLPPRRAIVRRQPGSPAMNQHANIATTVPAGISPDEWQARIDLAAVYRLCSHYGWDDVIYNHCSMRVPGEPTKFLMKQHELLWTEVTASNLRKVDMNDDLDEKSPASTGRASPCTAAC